MRIVGILFLVIGIVPDTSSGMVRDEQRGRSRGETRRTRLVLMEYNVQELTGTYSIKETVSETCTTREKSLTNGWRGWVRCLESSF